MQHFTVMNGVLRTIVLMIDCRRSDEIRDVRNLVHSRQRAATGVDDQKRAVRPQLLQLQAASDNPFRLNSVTRSFSGIGFANR